MEFDATLVTTFYLGLITGLVIVIAILGYFARVASNQPAKEFNVYRNDNK